MFILKTHNTTTSINKGNTRSCKGIPLSESVLYPSSDLGVVDLEEILALFTTVSTKVPTDVLELVVALSLWYFAASPSPSFTLRVEAELDALTSTAEVLTAWASSKSAAADTRLRFFCQSRTNWWHHQGKKLMKSSRQKTDDIIKARNWWHH